MSPLPTPRPTAQGPDRTPHRVDVLALVAGLLVTGVALILLWTSVGGDVDWSVVKIGAPLLLVVVGVVGLTVSRRP